jgi:hypothetical protein
MHNWGMGLPAQVRGLGLSRLPGAALGLLFGLLLLAGCRKEQVEALTVWGNTPPPYFGMSSEQLQVLSSRIYIDLIGRGATPDELEGFIAQWRADSLSVEGLEALVQDLQQQEAYFSNMDVLFWGKCLNAADNLTLANEIWLYQTFINQALLVGDTVLAYLYEPILEDLFRLRDGAEAYRAGEIGMEDYLARIVHNTLYDNVNMGSENFVLATFENLYFRKPTAYELAQGIVMVDGWPGFLFLQDGNNKRDFVRIATRSAPFYEGLVMEAYRHLLGTTPTTPQLAAGLEALGSSSDYQALQRHIITGPGYANLLP